MSIIFTVNGQQVTVPDTMGSVKLIDYLGDTLNLTGTKLCCGIAVCRACTVQMRRSASFTSEPIVACSTPLSELHRSEITTVEGVAQNGALSPIQEAFLENFSFQCGYCAPGFVMAATIFLEWLQTASVSEAELDDAIEDAIGPHICRCTGYVRYYEAVRKVALAQMNSPQSGAQNGTQNTKAEATQ